VFYHDNKQRATAEKLIEELGNSRMYDGPIATKVEPFEVFYKAEDYHNDYFRNHPAQPYCKLVIAPKIAKLREDYRNKLKRS